MPSQAYNLVWFSPSFPASRRGSAVPFSEPHPKTVENMLRIAQQNSQADVNLWVDSTRLTEAQMQKLHEMPKRCETHNFYIKDLQTIRDYSSEPFYSRPDVPIFSRHRQDSLFWRQIDAIKLLVSLQGDYDQVIYADADVTNIIFESKEVQQRLTKNGLLVSAYMNNDNSILGFENQVFGFDRRRKDFFRKLYYETFSSVGGYTLSETSTDVYDNGWPIFIKRIDELIEQEGMVRETVAFSCGYDGTGVHPMVREETSPKWRK